MHHMHANMLHLMRIDCYCRDSLSNWMKRIGYFPSRNDNAKCFRDSFLRLRAISTVLDGKVLLSFILINDYTRQWSFCLRIYRYFFRFFCGCRILNWYHLQRMSVDFISTLSHFNQIWFDWIVCWVESSDSTLRTVLKVAIVLNLDFISFPRLIDSFLTEFIL